MRFTHRLATASCFLPPLQPLTAVHGSPLCCSLSIRDERACLRQVGLRAFCAAAVHHPARAPRFFAPAIAMRAAPLCLQTAVTSYGADTESCTCESATPVYSWAGQPVLTEAAHPGRQLPVPWQRITSRRPPMCLQGSASPPATTRCQQRKCATLLASTRPGARASLSVSRCQRLHPRQLCVPATAPDAAAAPHACAPSCAL